MPSTINIIDFFNNNIHYVETYIDNWGQVEAITTFFEYSGFMKVEEAHNILYSCGFNDVPDPQFQDANPKAPKALIAFLKIRAEKCIGKKRRSLKFIKLFLKAMSLALEKCEDVDGLFGDYE